MPPQQSSQPQPTLALAHQPPHLPAPPHTHTCRHSAASWKTRTTDSTSSPLTWKMGALMALATSVQYGELRPYLGSVVKAT